MSKELEDCWKKCNELRYLNICKNNTGNVRVNIKLRSVRIANIAAEKQ
jgi:hypothetical protein